MVPERRYRTEHDAGGEPSVTGTSKGRDAMTRTPSSKQVAGILAFAVIVQLLVAVAAFGPTVTSAPRGLPLGLVDADTGVEGVPRLGAALATAVTDAPGQTAAWTRFASESALRTAMADRRVYGGVVLPADLSERVALEAGGGSEPARMSVLVNEGMHPAGVQAARGVLTSVADGAAQLVAQQRLGAFAAAGGSVAADQLTTLVAPPRVEVESVHAPRTPTAAQLPLVLTVLLWLGTLIASLFLFVVLHRPGQAVAAFVGAQLSTSLGLAVVLPAPVLAIAAWVLAIPVGAGVALYALLVCIALAFLLLQAAVLDWLGFAGWPLLVILWLFGSSVLAVPPEFLADGYRTWVYSWIPFRYAFEALQGLLHFDASVAETAGRGWILGAYGAAALLAVLASRQRLDARDVTVHPLARRFGGAGATRLGAG